MFPMNGKPFQNFPQDRNEGRSAEVKPYLFSLATTAQLLGGITEREIYNRIEAGDLEGVYIGRRRMVTRESVETYVERLRKQSRGSGAA